MKIDGRDIVHTSILIVPDGEDAWVEFNVDNWHINLSKTRVTILANIREICVLTPI